MAQVDNKSRLGINALESFVLKDLNCIFRKQPIQDIFVMLIYNDDDVLDYLKKRL